jgi:hypothetical protein
MAEKRFRLLQPLKKVAADSAHIRMKEHGELLLTECAMKNLVSGFLEKAALMRSVCDGRQFRAVK